MDIWSRLAGHEVAEPLVDPMPGEILAMPGEVLTRERARELRKELEAQEKAKDTPAIKRNSGKIVSSNRRPSHSTCSNCRASAQSVPNPKTPHTATITWVMPMIISMSKPRKASSDSRRPDVFMPSFIV